MIRHRLSMSKVNKAPLSLSRLIQYMQGKEDKIDVLVGTVTDDVRVSEVPALKVSHIATLSLMYNQREESLRRLEESGTDVVSVFKQCK
jgi:ribosomal protein L18E